MVNEQTPLISIIAINWNTTRITAEFLRSIKEHNTYQNIEIIIIDNGSEDNPTSVLKEIIPDSQVILTGENLGFSGGNNVGIRASKGDFLFIVNNDTEFTPGLLEGLLEIFQNHPDAGLVSPKFHYFFEKGTIEYAGYESVNIFTGRNGMIGCREKDIGQYNDMKETNYAHGGGMMVSRKVIEEVGPMYEPFFLYYEELDWSRNIRKHGYKIYYQPASLIYHKESMTTGKMSSLKTFYITRNRIWFMRRNIHWAGFSVFMIYFTFFTIPKNSLTFLLRGQKEHLRSFWKGIWWHFNRKITFN